MNPNPFSSTEPTFLEAYPKRHKGLARLRVGLAIALVLNIAVALTLARQWGWL